MPRKLKIGKRSVGDGCPVLLIAEAGVNHNGDERLAHRLIDAAAAAGADAVKFQTFLTEELVSRRARRAEHHVRNVKDEVSHFDLIKRLELPFEAFRRLKKHAEASRLLFISTPYDLAAAKYLVSIGVKAMKIASGEVTNAPLVDYIASSGLPTILSTGMNDRRTIHAAVKALSARCPLAVLKCTSNYPVDYANVNLRGIHTLMKDFPKPVIGFSDHTMGTDVACAAVALGAKIIEKHFTLDRTLWGPDQKASLDPKGFAALVAAVRNVEESLGSAELTVVPTENIQVRTMQKSIFARRDLEKGARLTLGDLMFLRPSGGIPPSDYKRLVGKECRERIRAGTMIKLAQLKIHARTN